MADINDILDSMLAAIPAGAPDGYLLPEEPFSYRFAGRFFRGCQLLWRQREAARAGFAPPPLDLPLVHPAAEVVPEESLERAASAAPACREGRAAEASAEESPRPPSGTMPSAACREASAESEEGLAEAPLPAAAAGSGSRPAGGTREAAARDAPQAAPEPGEGGPGESSPPAARPRKRMRRLDGREGSPRDSGGSPPKRGRKGPAQDGGPGPTADAAAQGTQADPGSQKPKAPRRAPRPRVAGPKSPVLPLLAFEWFRQGQSGPDAEQHQGLPELVQRWKALSNEERAAYIQMAQEDQERFKSEYAAWQEGQSAPGAEGSQVDDILAQRRSGLEKRLAQADRRSQGGGGAAAARGPKLPPGHPQPTRSAYAIFCKEAAPGLRAARAPAQEPPVAKEPPAAEAAEAAGARPKRPSVLTELRRAWQALSEEGRARYEVLAAQDGERFAAEFEAWRAQQPHEGLGEEAAAQLAGCGRGRGRGRGRPRLPRPRVPLAAHINLAKADPSEVRMDDVLLGAAALGLEEERAERRQRAREAKEAREAQRPGAPRGGAPRGAPPGPDAGAGAGGSSPEGGWQGAASPGGGPLPVPQGAPAAIRPESSVDELFGGLVPLDSEEEEDGPGGPAAAGEGALLPHEDFFEAPAWSDTPEATGAPRVLGPQLRLDEAGNIVLDHSSLTQGLDQEQPLEGGPVRESVSQYASAYRKTPACRWSDGETDMFYEALALYGTDLFLVQTFFRNKSAAQIKTKYSKELRKNPHRVEEALTTRMRPLTKDTFERLHGKIDTSKHYRPPPSPLPGEEPEPDGSVPAQEEPAPPEAETPPPEPEYSAEDESLTTNRLMALFD